MKYDKVINWHKFEDTISQLIVEINYEVLKGNDLTDIGVINSKMDTYSTGNSSRPSKYLTALIQGSNKAII